MKSNTPMMQRISLGVPFKWRTFLDALRDFDRNKDGKIQAEEFITFWVSQCSAAETQEASSCEVNKQARADAERDAALAQAAALKTKLDSALEQYSQLKDEYDSLQEERKRHAAELEELELHLRRELKEADPTHNADASRAALMAVADANSKLQMQVATLTEQRTTLGSALTMVQQELDLKHENNIDLQNEVADLQ